METMNLAEYRSTVRKDRKTPAQRHWATQNQSEDAERLRRWRAMTFEQRVAHSMASALEYARTTFDRYAQEDYHQLTDGDEFAEIDRLIGAALDKLRKS